MPSGEPPVLRDVVLIGGGHSHLAVLKRFATRPMPGVRLTLISRDTQTPYSGMLPGYIAGHYRYDEVHIDLRRLAASAGARFHRAEVVGLERAQRLVLCRGRSPVRYDLLSIDTGSVPQLGGIAGAERHGIPVKPIDRFNAHWLALLARVRCQSGRTRILVVGGGASGVELALSMHYRLRNERRAAGLDPEALEFHLLTRGKSILPTHRRRVRRLFEALLQRRGIVLRTEATVCRATGQGVETTCGDQIDADEIVWATGGGGAPWLQRTALELDGRGCVRVQDTLQTVSDPRIFAAGDVASLSQQPPEKAGVYAVRMGAVLAANLQRAVQQRRLRRYRPQRRALALISTGEQHAVASRGVLCLSGAWVWHWKDRIDRRFMATYERLPVMSAPVS